MKKIIPDNNHVMRHISLMHYQNGRISGSAFVPSHKDKRFDRLYGLSVFWNEFYSNKFKISLKSISKDAIVRNLKRKLALINVGKTKEYISTHCELTFFQESTERDSHSEITGCTPDDDFIGCMISETILSIHDVVDTK